jgi:hypothetical protein
MAKRAQERVTPKRAVWDSTKTVAVQVPWLISSVMVE